MQIPKVLAIRNQPNPFNPSTVFHYSLPQAGEVILRVFDIRGQLVRTLVNHKQAAGYYQAVWDGRDSQGREVRSGVYVYKLLANGKTLVRRAVMMK